MKALCTAMAKAFAAIEGATKDKTNPHFKSKYADLSTVVDAIKPALSKHGLFFVQVTHDAPQGVCVETIICHESGEQMSAGRLYVPASKQDPQGYGSALTYARRYSLMAAFGVPAEDDDGNAAVKAHKESKEARDVTPERQRIVRRVADACIAAHAKGDEWGAYENACGITDAEERLLLWDYLHDHSSVRSAIKRLADAERAKEAA